MQSPINYMFMGPINSQLSKKTLLLKSKATQ